MFSSIVPTPWFVIDDIGAANVGYCCDTDLGDNWLSVMLHVCLFRLRPRIGDDNKCCWQFDGNVPIDICVDKFQFIDCFNLQKIKNKNFNFHF